LLKQEKRKEGKKKGRKKGGKEGRNGDRKRQNSQTWLECLNPDYLGGRGKFKATPGSQQNPISETTYKQKG
jgi:hypothetical protein